MLQNIRRLKTELLAGVESLVKEKKLSYLDAVIHFCESNGVDLDQAGQIIQNNKKMTSKLKKEAAILNLLR